MPCGSLCTGGTSSFGSTGIVCCTICAFRSNCYEVGLRDFFSFFFGSSGFTTPPVSALGAFDWLRSLSLSLATRVGGTNG